MKRVSSRDISEVLGGRSYVQTVARDWFQDIAVKGSYHPGNLTCDTAFKQDEPPALSERVVTTSSQPVLYDANDRPIYRKAGFAR